MSEHILVLGATGQTGIDFCSAALPLGHKLTLYVRTPSKLPKEISSNENVTIIQGTLEDEEGLKKAAASGASIFVSFAGPTYGSKGTPVTDCLKILFPLLITHSYKRALILGTPSFTSPEDKGGLKWKASVVLIKIIGGTAYAEFSGLGKFVTETDLNSLKWTLFRVGFLGNGESRSVTATYTGSGRDGMMISRKSIASWVLREMGEGSEFVGKAPFICN